MLTADLEPGRGRAEELGQAGFRLDIQAAAGLYRAGMRVMRMLCMWLLGYGMFGEVVSGGRLGFAALALVALAKQTLEEAHRDEGVLVSVVSMSVVVTSQSCLVVVSKAGGLDAPSPRWTSSLREKEQKRTNRERVNS
jgi:hypothetical protein